MDKVRKLECPPQFPVKGGHMAHSFCSVGLPGSSEASQFHKTRGVARVCAGSSHATRTNSGPPSSDRLLAHSTIAVS
jgi:hypothetical protein